MKPSTIRSVGHGFLYALVVTPLIFLPQFFVFPYIVPKVVAMRSLIVLALSAACLLYIAQKRATTWRTWASPLSVALVCFFVSQLISTFVGFDWYRSLWETHERMVGVFTVLHFVILFFVARTILQNKTEWRRLWQWWLGVALVVIGIGVIQKFSPNFLFNRGNDRVLSTLGNPIYLAAYGLFTFFLALRHVAIEKGLWQKIWIGGAALGLVGIIISGGRGTMLGLLVGLLTMSALAVRFGASSQIRRRALVVCLTIAGAAAVFIGVRQMAFVQHVPVLNRLATISTSDYTGQTRLLAWNVAFQSWKDYPVFGWGPSNFYYAFSAHYNPAFLKFGFQETWFDNAHNVLVDTLATGGIVGLFTYLSIFVAAIYTVFRSYKQKLISWQVFTVSIGFLIAHTVHNLFVFENASSYLALMLWFAWIDAELKRDSLPSESANKGVSIWVLGAVGVATMAVLLVSEVNVAVVAHNNLTMRQLLSQGKVQESIDVGRKSERWHSPHIYDLQWNLATDSIVPLPRVYGGNKLLARTLYDTAVSDMESVLHRYPNDVRAHLAYMDILRSGGIVLFELPVQKTVEEHLATAERLSPGRQQIIYSKITFLAGTGHLDEAVEMAKEQVAREPKVGDGYYTLARLYTLQKKYYKIINVLDLAVLSGVRFSDPEIQGFVAEGYEREGRFLDALYWYDQMYRTTGNDRVAYKRDELARQTQLAIPNRVEDFFPFQRFVSSSPEL